METQQNTHWDSPEFDKLMDIAEATQDLDKFKEAYLFAKSNAPPGTITAGKDRFERVRSIIIPDVIEPLAPVVANGYPINLEDLRHSLKEKGALE